MSIVTRNTVVEKSTYTLPISTLTTESSCDTNADVVMVICRTKKILLLLGLLTFSSAHTLNIRVTVGVGKGTAGCPQTCILATLAVARRTGMEKEIIVMIGATKNSSSPIAFL